MDPIAMNQHIDGPVKLDSSQLRTFQLLVRRDIIDVISDNPAECSPHAATNSTLTTIVDRIVPYHVRTDMLAVPSVPQRFEYDLDVVQRTVKNRIGRPHIVSGRTLLTQRNSRTFGVVNDIVLNDPPLIPICCDHSDLFSRRGRPLRCGLTEPETTDRDVVDTGFRRIETGATYGDLHQLPIGILLLKIGPKRCRVLITFAIPRIKGPIGIRQRRVW